MIIEKRVRSFSILIGLFILSLMVVPLASAYYLPSVRSGIDQVIMSLTDIFKPILYALFGSVAAGGDLFLFERLLLFLLLMALVFASIKKSELFEGQPLVIWLIAIIVPLFAVRYLSFDWIDGILTQYVALGIALTVILPFIIYFYFLYKFFGEYDIIRKIGWVLFIVIYTGLWSGSANTMRSDLYFWAIFAAVFCLVSDSWIQKKLLLREMYKGQAQRLNQALTKINNEILQLEKELREKTAADPNLHRMRIKELKKEYKFLTKTF